MAIGKVSSKLAWARISRPLTGLGVGKRLVARADVPLAAILRGLEARRDEDVDEQQQRAEREDFEFNRHVVSPPVYGIRIVSFASGSISGKSSV